MIDTITRKQAKELKLKKYFTGKPCKHGHISDRYTKSARCKMCVDLESEKWRKTNFCKVVEQRKRYYQDNKTIMDTRSTLFRKQHPEKRAEYVKKWADNNKERIKGYQRKYRLSNQHKCNARTARWIANVKRATPLWSEIGEIEQVYQECRNISKQTGNPHEVDHIIPIHSDYVCGLHCLDNLQIITEKDNRTKNNICWPDMEVEKRG